MNSIHSIIISDVFGIGRTHDKIQQIIKNYTKNKEYNINVVSTKRMNTTELYTLLYNNRFDNSVLVLENTKDMLTNMDCFYILKSACGLDNIRKISWTSNLRLGYDIPKEFNYEGIIIIITNEQLDSPLMQIFVSRSIYKEVIQ